MTTNAKTQSTIRVNVQIDVPKERLEKTSEALTIHMARDWMQNHTWIETMCEEKFQQYFPKWKNDAVKFTDNYAYLEMIFVEKFEKVWKQTLKDPVFKKKMIDVFKKTIAVSYYQHIDGSTDSVDQVLLNEYMDWHVTAKNRYNAAIKIIRQYIDATAKSTWDGLPKKVTKPYTKDA